VAAENGQQTVADAASRKEILDLVRDFHEALATRANRQNGDGLAQHGVALMPICRSANRSRSALHAAQKKSARLSTSAL
jgi:hypothetical protein